MEHWLARMQLIEPGGGGTMTLAKFNAELGWHERNSAKLSHDFQVAFGHLGKGQQDAPTDFAFLFNQAGGPDSGLTAAQVEYDSTLRHPELVLRSAHLGGEVVVGEFSTAGGWQAPTHGNLTKEMVSFLHNAGQGSTDTTNDFVLVVIEPPPPSHGLL